jgi:2-furoyl-CoA dehydrogenase 2Fe-2S iron sulfur subunit
MIEQHAVRFTVNGKTHEGVVEPRMLLSDYLRNELGLTGTHVGCEHGVCGACTILFDGEGSAFLPDICSTGQWTRYQDR